MKGSEAVSGRQAAKTDLNFILGVENACFSSADAFKADQILYLVRNPRKSCRTEIILYGKNQAGWASFLLRKNSSSVRLYSIALLPEFSGKGIARNYLNQMLSAFPDCRRMLLEVRASNSRAIKLYENLGFKVIHELPGYYPDGESGVKMEREL